MPTLILRNGEGRDLAFLLISGDSPLAEGGATRDCLFMQLPLPGVPAEAAFFAERKHVEFMANVRSTAQEVIIEFEAGPGARFCAALSTGGNGRWRAEQESVPSLEGLCALLASKS